MRSGITRVLWGGPSLASTHWRVTWSGSAFGADEDRALEVARRIETGNIGINFYSSNYAAPFVGRKDSGVGVEFGPEGLAAYQVFQSEQFGGIRVWLRDAGLSDNELAALHDRLTELDR